MDWLAELGGVGNLTGGAGFLLVVTLIIRAIVRGDLVPATMMDRIVAAKDDQLDTQAHALAEYAEMNGTLIGQNETTHKMLAALADVSHIPQPKGQP